MCVRTTSQARGQPRAMLMHPIRMQARTRHTARRTSSDANSMRSVMMRKLVLALE